MLADEQLGHQQIQAAKRWGLPAFAESISRFNASCSNSSMLDSIRSYNHFIIGEFNKIAGLEATTILDVGASPHYYAMEKCFETGVARYVGIGLDIESEDVVLVEEAEGRLHYMNAENLSFPDESFDRVVSMSAFEHIGDLRKALLEINRVMKPGGKALISFEPLWTCAYGHHLHHLGDFIDVVPPWSHLVWDRERMRSHLEIALPPNAPVNADAVVSMVFDDPFINRVGIARMREVFAQAAMVVEWILPMMHDRVDHQMLDEAIKATGLSVDDLHTKGFSVLLSKRPTMKISVVTPSYNQGRFIERTLRSVSSQEVEGVEHLVFDGGSSDETVSILAAQGDAIRWVSERDRGQAHAVNKGIAASDGEIIGWLNSDDVYLPGALGRVRAYFEEHPEVDVLYGRADHVDLEDRPFEEYPTRPWDLERLREGCFLCQPAVFFRRRVVEAYGDLDESLHFCMDYEFWLRLGIAGAVFAYLPEKLAGSRLYQGNKTLGSAVGVHREINDMLRHKLGKVPDNWLVSYAYTVTRNHLDERAHPVWFARETSVRVLMAGLRWNGALNMSLLRRLFPKWFPAR